MDRCTLNTPFGRLSIAADEKGICLIRMAREDEPDAAAACGLPADAARQLEEYMAGKRTSFDLPLSLSGTAFERAVWAQLLDIPFGEKRTYGQIAHALGNPGAARAVGRACGANPVLVVVPCHRVVGAGGRLTGFAAGLDMKRSLLRLEGQTILGDRIAAEE